MSKDKSIEEKVVSPLLYLVGLLSLGVAVFSAGALAATKLGWIATLPGCGVGSSCDTVTNGPWGTIPGLNWPTSFLGVGWFVGMLWAWLRCARKPEVYKNLLFFVRIGVLASIGFIILMGSIGSFCKWCVLSHVCNFVFWVVSEIVCRRFSQSEDKGAGRPVVLTAFFPAFAVAQVFLAVSLQFVPTLGETVDDSTLELLEARHRFGPEDAAIQIVMFTDYQCPDCYRIEKQLDDLVAANADISVSVKHFPLCFDCNDNIGTFKLHPNACWAARAAEAASIVGGEAGWKKMHDWLFSQKGSFTDQSLPPALNALGFNPSQFLSVMTSDQTLQRVKEDSNDGFGLGVYFTPMVFINGVEWLWYYGGQGSLTSAIASVRASGGANIVPPPDADNKRLEDWRRGQRHSVPDQPGRSWLGDGDVEIIVWGDYQAAATKKLDVEVQKLAGVDSRVKYSYRHYPLDVACNSAASSSRTQYEGSCFLSKLVESLDVLGDPDSKWKMHNWMFEQGSPIQQSKALAYAATVSGIDQGTIQDAMEGLETTRRMRDDIALKSRVWRKSIPVLMVDGRFVPRWGGDGVDTQALFQRILSVVESEGSSSAGTSR